MHAMSLEQVTLNYSRWTVACQDIFTATFGHTYAASMPSREGLQYAREGQERLRDGKKEAIGNKRAWQGPFTVNKTASNSPTSSQIHPISRGAAELLCTQI